MRASTATLAARRALLSGPRSRRRGDSTRDRYGNSPLHKAAVSGACVAPIKARQELPRDGLMSKGCFLEGKLTTDDYVWCVSYPWCARAKARALARANAGTLKR